MRTLPLAEHSLLLHMVYIGVLPLETRSLFVNHTTILLRRETVTYTGFARCGQQSSCCNTVFRVVTHGDKHRLSGSLQQQLTKVTSDVDVHVHRVVVLQLLYGSAILRTLHYKSTV